VRLARSAGGFRLAGNTSPANQLTAATATPAGTPKPRPPGPNHHSRSDRRRRRHLTPPRHARQDHPRRPGPPKSGPVAGAQPVPCSWRTAVGNHRVSSTRRMILETGWFASLRHEARSPGMGVILAVCAVSAALVLGAAWGSYRPPSERVLGARWRSRSGR